MPTATLPTTGRTGTNLTPYLSGSTPPRNSVVPFQRGSTQNSGVLPGPVQGTPSAYVPSQQPARNSIQPTGRFPAVTGTLSGGNTGYTSQPLNRIPQSGVTPLSGLSGNPGNLPTGVSSKAPISGGNVGGSAAVAAAGVLAGAISGGIEAVANGGNFGQGFSKPFNTPSSTAQELQQAGLIGPPSMGNGSLTGDLAGLAEGVLSKFFGPIPNSAQRGQTRVPRATGLKVPSRVTISQYGPYTAVLDNVISLGAITSRPDTVNGGNEWIITYTTTSGNRTTVIGSQSQIPNTPQILSVVPMDPASLPPNPDGTPQSPYVPTPTPARNPANLLEPGFKNPTSPSTNPALPDLLPFTPAIIAPLVPITPGLPTNVPKPGGPSTPARPGQPQPVSPTQPGSPPLSSLPGVPTLNGSITGTAGQKSPTYGETPGSRNESSPQEEPKVPTTTPNLPPGTDPCCAKTSADLEEIKRVLGVKDFPSVLPLLSTEQTRTVTNIPQLILWNASCTDSVTGLYPAKVKVEQPDGTEKTITLMNQAHAIEELFAALLTVAEDADASVNIGARIASEVINTKIMVSQGNDLLESIQKFLGFAVKPIARLIKLNFNPAASGANGKLENYEMQDFLKPSTKSYVGTELADKSEMLPLMQRVLQNTEIARAAVWQPIKPDKKGRSPITGERIKATKQDGTPSDKSAWEQFKKDMKAQGFNIDETKQGGNK